MKIVIDSYGDIAFIFIGYYLLSLFPAVFASGFVLQALRDDEDQERAGRIVFRVFLSVWLLWGAAQIFAEVCL
jgi:hypothetical protein